MSDVRGSHGRQLESAFGGNTLLMGFCVLGELSILIADFRAMEAGESEKAKTMEQCFL